MRRWIMFIILILCSIVIFSKVTKEHLEDKKPTVYLVGSIHNMHFNPENNYSINDLLSQIKALKPDMVCGEITPDAYNQPMEGYFPPEAAVLAEMANELNYRFVPVDWRIDYATQSIADSNMPLAIEKKCVEIGNRLRAILKNSNMKSIYDNLHDSVFLNITDSLYEKIIGVNPIAEIASGSWHERNRRAVENGLNNSENAQTIVFVFGTDHLPQLKRQLQVLGIEAQIPKRMFVPSNKHKLPKAVIRRWERNLENLRMIRDKELPSTYDNYQKVIHSKRVENLTEAIEKSK